MQLQQILETVEHYKPALQTSSQDGIPVSDNVVMALTVTPLLCLQTTPLVMMSGDGSNSNSTIVSSNHSSCVCAMNAEKSGSPLAKRKLWVQKGVGIKGE